MMVSRRAAGFVREAPLAFTIASLAGVGVVGARTTALAFLGLALTPDREHVAHLLLVSVAAAAVELLLRATAAVAAARVAERVKAQVRRQLVDAVEALGPGWLRTRRAGQVQAALGDGVEALQGYLSAYLPQVVIATGGPGLVVIVMVVIDPSVGIVAAIGAVVLPLSKPVWRRVIGDRSRDHWEAYSALSARMLESLQGMATLKMLDAASTRRTEIAADTARLYRTTRAGLGVSLIAYCLAAVVVGLGVAVASVLAGVGVVERGLGAAAALVLMLVVAEVFRPLLELENYWGAGFHGRSAAETIEEILEVARPRSGGRAPATGVASTLRFVDVGFTYPGSAHAALDGLDLDVPAGRTMALVGRSGAGKSTLVHLLMRWYDADRGQVLVDGIDVRDLDVDAHRHRIAVVSQDVHLFAGTLADNLRLARPDATDDDLVVALDRAHCRDLLDSLPEGLDTLVGERGARLSGGERQRIAIARAILVDAPILVLDEATAALDGRAEAAVIAALDRARAGRTTLVIAHRLSTAASADLIAVLDHGRVVESGPAAELLSENGALSRLVAAQEVPS